MLLRHPGQHRPAFPLEVFAFPGKASYLGRLHAACQKASIGRGIFGDLGKQLRLLLQPGLLTLEPQQLGQDVREASANDVKVDAE